MTESPQQAVLLIALSARAYVQALKQAGYYTVVIDGFLDQETRFFADEAYQVGFDDLGFITTEFDRQLACLSSRHDWLGCVYGAGVEARPSLLRMVATHMPLLGNSPQTLHKVKEPKQFFAALEVLSISTPAWQLSPPKHTEHIIERWLKKAVGGSGGGHIQLAKPSDGTNEGVYFQREIKGEAVSVLFFACPKVMKGEQQAIMLGVHAQWEDATETNPYRIGGVVALDRLDAVVQHQLQEIIEKLTLTFDLSGLNALDVIVQGTSVNVLELNPRLSLSLDLYLQDYIQDAQVNLLTLHMLMGLYGCREEPTLKQQILHEISKLMAYHKRKRKGSLLRAIAIVYAPVSFEFKESVQWPEWVLDRPAEVCRIEQNCPVCSVVANAPTTGLAKEQALQRVAEIKSMLH